MPPTAPQEPMRPPTIPRDLRRPPTNLHDLRPPTSPQELRPRSAHQDLWMPPVEHSLSLELPGRPFKEKKCLATRKREVVAMRTRFPSKLPVIVERFSREKFLPYLDKTKFLVPKDMSVGQFMSILRNRMPLGHAHTFYFMVNGRTLVTISMSMAEVYAANRDEDGFLYLTYASQEVFG